MKPYLTIESFRIEKGTEFKNLVLTYELAGKIENLYSNGILICHALTGNSSFAGENGWWSPLFKGNNRIDLDQFGAICFDVPCNGDQNYSQEIINSYEDWTLRDVARLFLEGLRLLKITKLQAIVGASMGGCVAWEISVLQPELSNILVPIASDYKASDWVLAHNRVQHQILTNSKTPLNDARMMAMMFYRTPESFKSKFNRGFDSKSGLYSVESYLYHHGDKLSKRYKLSGYKFMNHLLSSHNIARGRQSDKAAIQQIQASIHLVGIDTDFFFPSSEDHATIDILKDLNHPYSYHQISSEHGHDAFLIDYDQLKPILSSVLKTEPVHKTTKSELTGPLVMKFGGKSLANVKDGYTSVLDIIQKKTTHHKKTVVVCSARGETTDKLLALIEQAKRSESYIESLEELMDYQRDAHPIDFSEENEELKTLYQSVFILGECSLRAQDRIMALGEKMSTKFMTYHLNQMGFRAKWVDTSQLIKTDHNYGSASVIQSMSEKLVVEHYAEQSEVDVLVYCGFIGSTVDGWTTTLGRNGSNYTATILANFLNAHLVENWTAVSGLYTADPQVVEAAFPLTAISYQQAYDLSNMGMKALHPKTVLPLVEKNIPLRIRNSFDPDQMGTLVSSDSPVDLVSAVSIIEQVAMIGIVGAGMRDVIGIDSRIFSALSQANISVRSISQSSSERSIGLVVDQDMAEYALSLLKSTFSKEIEDEDIKDVFLENDLSIVGAIGNTSTPWSAILSALESSNINPILFAPAIHSNFVSFLVKQQDLKQSSTLLHNIMCEKKV